MAFPPLRVWVARKRAYVVHTGGWSYLGVYLLAVFISTLDTHPERKMDKAQKTGRLSIISRGTVVN